VLCRRLLVKHHIVLCFIEFVIMGRAERINEDNDAETGFESKISRITRPVT